MTKRISSLILSLVMLGISSILLLIYFTFNGSDDSPIPLTLSAKNLTLYVGQTVRDFYQLSNNNASLSFNVSQSNIIDINRERVIGLNVGKVSVLLTASLDEQVIEQKIEVVVLNDGYTFSLTPIKNCHFEDSTLFTQNDFSVFSIDVFDEQNNKINYGKYNIVSSSQIYIQRDFNNFTLVANENCIVKFDFYEIEYVVEINVVLM